MAEILGGSLIITYMIAFIVCCGVIIYSFWELIKLIYLWLKY